MRIPCGWTTIVAALSSLLSASAWPMTLASTLLPRPTIRLLAAYGAAAILLGFLSMAFSIAWAPERPMMIRDIAIAGSGVFVAGIFLVPILLAMASIIR